MRQPRRILAFASWAIIAVVLGAATALGPRDERVWLLFCGVLALAAALQSATSDPAALAPSLLLSLPPVVALVADGSPTWMIAPLGTALLMAGELNALSWEEGQHGQPPERRQQDAEPARRCGRVAPQRREGGGDLVALALADSGGEHA